MTVRTRRPGVGGWRTPWWARRHPEEPLRALTCARDDCRKLPPGPFDVYCGNATEAHFLVLGGERRAQLAAVYATRAAFALLALIAAASRTPAPLYGDAAIVGLLVLALPLRRFPVSRLAAPPLWLAALALVAAVHEGWVDAAGRDAIATGVVAVLALAPLATAILDDDRRSEDVAARAMGSALTTALVVGLAATAFSLGVGAVSVPVRHALWWIALTALGGALGGAALTGFVRGVRRVHYDPAFTPPARLGKPKLRVPAAARRPSRPPRNAIDRLALVTRALALSLARRMVQGVNRVVAELVGWIDAVRRTATWALHKAKVWSWRLLLLTAAATRAGGVSLAAAAAVAAEVLRRWAVSTLLGAAALGAAATAAVAACGLFATYLTHGPLSAGVGAYALALAAVGVLVALWWALTRQPPREVLDGARRNAASAGPSAFLTLVALGWIDGIVGIAGYGPIRPGWLTIAGTAVIAASLAWSFRSE